MWLLKIKPCNLHIFEAGFAQIVPCTQGTTGHLNTERLEFFRFPLLSEVDFLFSKLLIRERNYNATPKQYFPQQQIREG